jgi:hypothetical protein
MKFIHIPWVHLPDRIWNRMVGSVERAVPSHIRVRFNSLNYFTEFNKL